MGGEQSAVDEVAKCAQVLRLLNRARDNARRIGSVCTGAFILAASGVANGRRLITHWKATARLHASFQEVELCEDQLYVEDDKVWSSAGVTAGIDMALAMIERDHGRKTMGQVARELVAYAKRPGSQSQFSSLLDAQTQLSDQYDELVTWLSLRLALPVRVEDMAKHMKMSKRTFCRRFRATSGLTPAAYFLRLRLERARELLEAGEAVKVVARDVGFRSEAGFRRAFERLFGVPPSVHRSKHA